MVGKSQLSVNALPYQRHSFELGTAVEGGGGGGGGYENDGYTTYHEDEVDEYDQEDTYHLRSLMLPECLICQPTVTSLPHLNINPYETIYIEKTYVCFLH